MTAKTKSKESKLPPSLHMKATISREKLLEALAAVTAAVPGKTTLPVLGNIRG